MSFAAGFASTFFPAIEEEIQGRKKRAEKNADLAWTMFTENMTKRQEARAEAERLRRQAETLVEANGGSRDMIPDVYNLLRDEVFDPAGLGEMIRSGRFQPVSTDTASDTGLSTTEALNAYGGPTREAASSLEETSEAGPDFWSGKEDIQAGIFTGESGGDYDALYGFSNRADGMFSNVTPTEMTVGEVLQFTQPEGAYAQWVKSQVGNVATPVGAYQIVGSTLQGAVDAGIVSADEKFDRSTQDKVGRYILDTQGTDAWVGYEGPADPALLSDTNPSYAEPTAEANPEDSQMAGMFNFRGDSGNAYSVDDQTREIFEERVRAAGMDPDEVDFSSTYDDPMGGGEQRYRIAPESVNFEEIFSEATTQEEVNRLVSVYGPNMSEAEIERAERYRESLPPEEEDLPSDIDDAALELAQAKDSGDEAAIREAQRNYDTLLRELERRQNAALNRERMAGTGAAPLIEAVVTDPRTNERRIEAVTIDPVSDTYTARDGTALDSSQVQGLTDQELDLYGKIPSQTITDSRRLRDSATSVIRMLDVGIDAIEIAERNPNVLGVRGSAASAATGFVRGVSGIVDVASEILQRQDSVTLQELEAELRSEGQLAEGQSLTQMDDQLLNALIPESIQGDARDRAILDSKLVLMAFRSGGLEGQSGNAMSNQDFNRLKDAVATANGNPEVFRTALGDYIRGTIQAHDAQVQQFSAGGPVGAFFERTGVMPIPVPQTVGDVVTASGNQKLMRSYQTFSEGMSQDTELSQSATPTGDAEGQAGLSQEEIIGIIEPFNNDYGPAARDRMQTKPPEERLEYMKNVAEELGVPPDSLRSTVFDGIEILGGTE